MLNSLKPQLSAKDEIIIVDSKSTDDTVAICRKYTNKIVTMGREGISKARNLGAEKAKNDIIAFIDADGTVSKDWISRIRRWFDRGRDAVCGLDLYTSRFPHSLVHNTYSAAVFYGIPLANLAGRTTFLIANNMAIRKPIFMKLKGFRNVVCEDVEFGLRLRELKPKVAYDSRMLVHYSPRRFEKEGFLKTLFLWYQANAAIIHGQGLSNKDYRKIEPR